MQMSYLENYQDEKMFRIFDICKSVILQSDIIVQALAMGMLVTDYMHKSSIDEATNSKAE